MRTLLIVIAAVNFALAVVNLILFSVNPHHPLSVVGVTTNVAAGAYCWMTASSLKGNHG